MTKFGKILTILTVLTVMFILYSFIIDDVQGADERQLQSEEAEKWDTENAPVWKEGEKLLLEECDFEDLFNSDTKSTGSINGQDGWVINSAIAQVINTTKYEGDQGLQFDNTAETDYSAAHALDSLSLWNEYIAIKRSTDTNQSAMIQIFSGSHVFETEIRLDKDSTDIEVYGASGYDDTGQDWTAENWIILNFEIDSTADTFKVRSKDGEAEWTDWSIDYDMAVGNALTEIDLYAGNYGSATTYVYFDTLTCNDPTAEEEPPPTISTATATLTKEQFETGLVGIMGIFIFLGILLGTRLLLTHISK